MNRRTIALGFRFWGDTLALGVLGLLLMGEWVSEFRRFGVRELTSTRTSIGQMGRQERWVMEDRRHGSSQPPIPNASQFIYSCLPRPKC